MAFCIYRSVMAPNGDAQLSERQALKLSGKQGFVAAYVESIKKSGESDWTLTHDELVAFLKKDDSKCAILFEIPKQSMVDTHIYALVKILGKVKGDRTEILVYLTAVNLQEGNAPETYVLKPDLSGKKLFEQLTLMGSFTGGTWSLAEPDNALTATVVSTVKS